MITEQHGWRLGGNCRLHWFVFVLLLVAEAAFRSLSDSALGQAQDTPGSVDWSSQEYRVTLSGEGDTYFAELEYQPAEGGRTIRPLNDLDRLLAPACKPIAPAGRGGPVFIPALLFSPKAQSRWGALRRLLSSSGSFPVWPKAYLASGDRSGSDDEIALTASASSALAELGNALSPTDLLSDGRKNVVELRITRGRRGVWCQWGHWPPEGHMACRWRGELLLSHAVGPERRGVDAIEALTEGVWMLIGDRERAVVLLEVEDDIECSVVQDVLRGLVRKGEPLIIPFPWGPGSRVALPRLQGVGLSSIESDSLSAARYIELNENGALRYLGRDAELNSLPWSSLRDTTVILLADAGASWADLRALLERGRRAECMMFFAFEPEAPGLPQERLLPLGPALVDAGPLDVYTISKAGGGVNPAAEVRSRGVAILASGDCSVGRVLERLSELRAQGAMSFVFR